MVQMAQRSSAEVHAILLDHGRAVETAYITCLTCRKRGYSARLDDKGVSDAVLGREFREAGWQFLGYGRWVCPLHRRGVDDKPRCSKCGRWLSGTGIFTSDSYDADEIMTCKNPRHKVVDQ